MHTIYNSDYLRRGKAQDEKAALILSGNQTSTWAPHAFWTRSESTIRGDIAMDSGKLFNDILCDKP